VKVERGVLVVSGKRSQEKKDDNEKWHRVERSYGSFRRAFKLPDGIKEDEISATFKDGVLEVAVPKTEQALPNSRKIAIQ
jgi:HSP20 family protein